MIYSSGITASMPYTKLKGMCYYFVNVLQAFLYTHSTVGIHSSQSSRLTEHTLVNPCNRILLKASAVPFTYSKASFDDGVS